MNKIIDINSAIRVADYGGDEVLAEVVEISPSMAAQWLKANKLNRPLNKGHVHFLAGEMDRGHWQLNGQAVVISADESVLDGQHRLEAIIESGKTIRTLVVYGITSEAFKTMDTGRNRTASDALSLHYPKAPRAIAQATGTAARWSITLYARTMQRKTRISNTEVLAHVALYPDLWRCSEILDSFPKDARPMPVGPCAALYHHFSRRCSDAAEEFMARFFTGAEIGSGDAEYILRAMLFRDAQRTTAKLPLKVRMKMVIKAWNVTRRGIAANRQLIQLHHQDDSFIDII